MYSLSVDLYVVHHHELIMKRLHQILNYNHYKLQWDEIILQALINLHCSIVVRTNYVVLRAHLMYYSAT